MEWALEKICCPAPFQWPRLLRFLPIQPKRTQFKRNKSSCLLGNTDGLSPPHHPPLPCSTLLFPSLLLSPSQTHIVNTMGLHSGSLEHFSVGPKPSKRSSSWCCWFSKYLCSLSFKGHSWEKVDGVRSGWRTNEREGDMKRKSWDK